jgi:hypothetical protein
LSEFVMCHEHDNYQDEWRKDMFKFKSKTQNKGTKKITQKLKLKTWNVQDQSTKIFILQWNKKNVYMKITKQAYNVRS